MNGSSIQCNWSPSVSYSQLVYEYIRLVSLIRNHVDHDRCIDLPVFPKYSWLEIFVVVLCAGFMAKVRYKSLIMLIHQINMRLEGLPRHAAFKIAMYSVKLLETSTFVWFLVYFLMFDVSCPAIVNLHIFNDPSEQYFPLQVMSLLAMARTLSHLHDLVLSRKYDKRKDDHLMVVHHLVTVVLLITARHNILIGMWVLLLHDVCDPIIDVCKIAQVAIQHLPGDIARREAKLSLLSKVQDAFCLFLIITWIFCRLYLFPNRVIHATIVSTSLRCRYSIGFTCSSLFFLLMVMHFLWFYLIIKFVLVRVFFGKRRDTSEADQDDSENMEENCDNKMR